MENYTPEQIKDINDRQQECLDFIKEKNLTLSAITQSTNLGNDVFGIKVIPYLKDLKYSAGDTKPTEEKSIEEAQIVEEK